MEQYDSVFVYGAFSNWTTKPDMKMKYIEACNCYKTGFLLKQGYYNYKFVGYDRGRLETSGISGSHQRTENDYEIIIYHKVPGDFYYRVVGYTTLQYN